MDLVHPIIRRRNGSGMKTWALAGVLVLIYLVHASWVQADEVLPIIPPKTPPAGVLFVPRNSSSAPPGGILFLAKETDIIAYAVNGSSAEHELYRLPVGARARLDQVNHILRLFLANRVLDFYDIIDPEHPRYLGRTTLPPPPPPPPPLPWPPGNPKGGRGFMVNAKIGPSLRIEPSPASQLSGWLAGSFTFDVGFTVNRTRSLSVVLSPQFDFFDDSFDSKQILIGSPKNDLSYP